MERGVTSAGNRLNIPVDDEIELRRVSAADCDELYAAIDRNHAHLHRWLPWVTATFQQSDLIEFIRHREIDNAARVSLTTNIWMARSTVP